MDGLLISDAIVDYYNSKKMAYYYIRNVQKDICIFMNDAKDGNHPLVAVNDTRHASEGEVKVTDVASGKQIFEGKFYVPANGRSADLIATQTKGTGYFINSL